MTRKTPEPFPGCIGDIRIEPAPALPARIGTLKLSELAKRDEIRAWPIRDTRISRWYHNRTVWRTIKSGSPPITGSFYTPDASGLNVIIHADLDNPAGIPSATWWLTAADFSWEVYRPVDLA